MDDVPLTYLDNNATTRPDPRVVAAMLPFLETWWGNPSSAHRFGQHSRAAVDEARAKVAALVGCRDSEITFTGGGTEATNTILNGLLRLRSPRRKIVTGAAEHAATRETCQRLDGNLADVVEVPVDDLGRLDMDRLAAEIDDEAAFVSLLWANNETGTICDVAAAAELCKSKKVPLHCDATQAVGKLPCDFAALGFDAATFAAHKFHGPKGVGHLYARRGLRLSPLIVGGPQERDRRGGTENVPGIVGSGEAAVLALEHLADIPRVAALRDDLESRVLAKIDAVRVNGDVDNRLPNTSNLGFAHLEAEAILLMLSEQGVCASAGAACSSGSLEPSHVLRAMRVPEIHAHGSVRFSLSRLTTPAEIDRLLDVLPRLIARLRAVLPIAAR